MFARSFGAAQLVVSVLLISFLSPVNLQAAAVDSDDQPVQLLRPWEIEDLVEPIALYPDSILKALLPAATFPDQIVDAGLQIRTAADAALIKDQTWDPSVKVIATYPGVLKMMYEKLDWTSSLGQAFLNQNDEVMQAIQGRRAKAKELGNLKSDEHQSVTTETTDSGTTVIVVQPTDPEVIYVPTTTTVVYEKPVESSTNLTPLVTFGLGMALGAAMADDDDDDHYYYGGGYWGGGYNMWRHPAHYDNWVDHRNDAWNDYNDRANDRQDFRQDRFQDQQQFNQDRVEQRQDFRQDRINDGAGAANRQADRAAANYGYGNRENINRDSMKQNAANRSNANQNSASRSSFENRAPQKATTAGRSTSGSAFTNYDKKTSASASAKRGVTSRASTTSRPAKTTSTSRANTSRPARTTTSRPARQSSSGGARSGGGRRR